MRSPGELKKEIESRLKGYLSRDRDGIRHELLNLFVKVKSLTIPQIYEKLQERFSVSYHSIASMVGIIASRIGILHVRRNAEGTNSIYELKDQYVDVVANILVAT
ncbi:hypothetical protein L21_1663 [Methanoculleus chikugoensis]|uniref:DUF2551 domain-containing protein n=1 Tax=Methanoculleus chikugoensis TaxID=118126 RepID=A0A1M4MLD8_9EURY|nr:DUF2551 domain-containing protein [Methanoculleus chikugoensis]MDD4566397.1 DUF2551 domain-containing protein [Methanoculleus chikugoensis]NMA11517.1 DUF2551 domain-containing protein [Methanomicrobiales archaeon]BBL68566.1 hypothetical protein MchiMG62_17470 [Methanoculleus chikugoensis]SCL75751.1 hypothetical protein L21_1663 [Methanoculleus chikugoensis]